MRRYLFELRKKANKTQVEVDAVIRSILGYSPKYGFVEDGSGWKEITPERASALAAALETTPENILELEKTEGGYVGAWQKNYRSSDKECVCLNVNEHKNEPLTEEEKAITAQYYPYARKVTDILRFGKYYFALNKYLDYEDFEDIGMLALIRAVKAVSYQKEHEKRVAEALLDHPDGLYHSYICKVIERELLRHIKAQGAAQRRCRAFESSLDSTVEGKDGDGSELHNFFPDKSQDIFRDTASRLALYSLFKYLDDKQKNICCQLIRGKTKEELIRVHIATGTDIGVIKFYLSQQQKYGKILWKADEYISGQKNVNYRFKNNRWGVSMYYGNKSHSLGEYDDLVTAIDVQRIGESMCIKRTFPEWYERHLKNGVFSFSLEDENIDMDTLVSSGNKMRKTIGEATEDNPCGVRYDKEKRHFTAFICGKRLGSFQTQTEALSVRQEAERHIKGGDFDEWYAILKKQNADSRIPPARIKQDKKTGNYMVTRFCNRHNTNLGTYGTYDEAVKVKELADEHIKGGDFDEWAVKFYADYRAALKMKKAIKVNMK